MHYFWPRNKFKLQFLPYSSPFFYLAFDNKSVKGEQSDSSLWWVASRRNWSRLTEVKSTDVHSILTTNINKRRGEKRKRRKKCHIFASVKKVDSKWDKPSDFFTRKLIYSGAKWRLTICILKSNPRHEHFRTVARHIKCLFLQVRGESGPLV